MANIEQALTQIAAKYNLNAQELIAYAYEDETGGYHSTASLADFPMGNIWAVEGRVLYALVRAIKPTAFSIGAEVSCARDHILAAIKAIDNWNIHEELPADFIWLDNIHGVDDVANAWVKARDASKPGAFIVMHDATHFLVGAKIQQGIRQAGVTDVLLLDIQPSDCGLAVWRKPTQLKDVSEDFVRFIPPMDEPIEHSPGGILPEAVVQELEEQGYIEPIPEQEFDLDAMTRAELRIFAEDHHIDLGDLRAKTDIRAAIDAALGEGSHG